MQPSKEQKKYIRKHRRTRSIQAIAAHTGLPESAVVAYIRRQWGDTGTQSGDPTVVEHTVTGSSIPEWTIFAGLSLTVMLLYAWTLPYAFISDDISYLVQNPLIHSFRFVTSTPLTSAKALLDWIVFLMFGLNPVFFRMLNLLFHLGTSWMLYLVVTRLAGRRTGVIAAFLFAVHPLVTESVTWIGGGGYPQYAFFFLVSFYWYLRSAEASRYRWFSVGAFLLMLLSSEKSIPLAAAFPVFELSRGMLRRHWKRAVPHLMLSGVWIFLVLVVFRYAQTRIATLESDYYNQSAGFYNPLIQIPVAITTYLQLFVFPSALSFYHSEVITRTVYIWKVTGLILFLAALAVSWFRERKVFFFLALLVISLSPSLSPLKIAWVVAERYAYLATAALAAVAAIVLGKIALRPRAEIPVYLFISLTIVGLATRTVIRNTDWQNQDTLWVATGKTAPADPKTHNNLGDTYGRHGDLNAAELEFRKAIALQPNYADAHHNLGNVLMQLKRPEEAKEEFKKALTYNSGLWQSHQSIAAIDFAAEKYDEALAELNAAVAINPTNPLLYENLGVIYRKTGDTAKAKSALEHALSLDPNDTRIRQMLSELE